MAKEATAKAKIAPKKDPSVAAAMMALRRAIEREVVADGQPNALRRKIADLRAEVRGARALKATIESLRAETERLRAEKRCLHQRVLAQNEELRKERNDDQRVDG